MKLLICFLQTTGGFFTGDKPVTVIWTPTIRLWFCIQLFCKILLELLFVYLYFKLQGTVTFYSQPNTSQLLFKADRKLTYKS